MDNLKILTGATYNNRRSLFSVGLNIPRPIPDERFIIFKSNDPSHRVPIDIIFQDRFSHPVKNEFKLRILGQYFARQMLLKKIRTALPHEPTFNKARLIL